MNFTDDSPYSKGNRNSLITATIKEGCTTTGNINNMLNGSSNEDFYFVNGCSNVWILFSFKEPVCIEKIKWIQNRSAGHGKWKLQGSNNKIQFVDLSTEFVLDNVIINIKNNKKYKYYKLQQVEGTTSSSPWLYEIEFGINLVVNKFLIKQNGKYYTIKSEFYKNGEFKPVAELEEKEVLTQNDFKIYGIDDLNLLTETINTQVINGIDKGNLGNGKYFQFKLNNDIKKINDCDKIYLTESIENFESDNKFNFDGRWQIITDSDSNIKNYLFSTPPGSYKSSNLTLKCKCKKIKFKYKLTYTSGHGSYSLTVDQQKLNIDYSREWRIFEMKFDDDVEHEFKFSLSNDGEYTRLYIDNISISTMTNKQLIQYNNKIYTFDEESIKLSLSQELNEDNFKINGFIDATVISSQQWNKIFPNKENVKILMWTNNLEKQQCKMIYNCEPFRPIEILKKNNNGKFEVLMKRIK